MTGTKRPPVDPALRRRFQRRLLAWYRRHGRRLPWRETRDPYRVLVSEIMLQQTQVERVVPKYHEFLVRYPTLEELARAPVDEVRRTWYPLGYNIRPVRLHAIAREAVARYGGKLPDDPEALLRFKGIGRYTAGAVLAFAYARDAPILDTNVRRLVGRVFLGRVGLRRLKGQKRLWELVAALIPRGGAYDFNQALMDFGALVCTARRPRCPDCPMRRFCRSYPWDSSEGGSAPLPTPPPVGRRRPRAER